MIVYMFEISYIHISYIIYHISFITCLCLRMYVCVYIYDTGRTWLGEPGPEVSGGNP